MKNKNPLALKASEQVKFVGKAKIRPKKSDTLFLPYQERWIKDTSRIKLMEKSRQIGISWATAYRAVRQAGVKDANYDFWVSSRDDLQAKLFLEDCKHFANILNAGAKDLGQLVLEDKAKSSAYVLEFSNNKRINSMSSNPDAQAGKRGSRILDEFALHKDARKLYSIAYPGITWGGSLEIISTHRGSKNFFNSLIEEAKGKNPKNISLHSVSLQTALDEGFLYKLQLKLPKDNPLQELDEAGYFDLTKSQCSDEESFLQEYMCVPADDEGAFLEFDLIDSCAYKAFENWQKDLINITNPLYIGVDIGRTSDLTVIWVVEKFADISFTRKIIELKNVSFSDQENILYPILSLENVRRCLIDSTGLGKQFAERAKERFGSYKIEEISFTNLIKSDLAYYLRHCFEDKKIRFPKNQNIISDLRNIRKTTTLSGNIRFEGERNSNGHSDRFWALALALYASKQSNESHISAIKADPLQNGRFI